MKICPTCRKTYSDEGLNFCLEDGSVLVLSNEPPPTVMMNQAPPTVQSPGFTNPNAQGFGSQAPQNYSMQPVQRSSKTLLWVLLILGGLAVVCSGGLIGFFAYVGSITDTNSNTNNSTPSNRIRTTRLPSNSTDPPDAKTTTETVDLTEWAKETSPYATKEVVGDELLMGTKEKGYYFVLVSQGEYTTEKATASLSVRNVADAATNLGFGIVFHSDIQPLKKGYAFLIDSKRKRFRVVRHEPSKEIIVAPWTNSKLIKDGTEANILEVRDKGLTSELYINGEMVRTIPNSFRSTNGVAGIYSGDGIKIAFKDLKLTK